MIRKCTKCLIEKEENIDNFRLRHYKNNIPFFTACCKLCEKKLSQAYELTRKEQRKQYDAKRRPRKTPILTLTERIEKRKKYLENYKKTHKISKEIKRQYYLNYYNKNKEKILKKDRKRNKIKKRKDAYNLRRKIRKQQDICFKLRLNFSSRVANFLRKFNQKKSNSILKILNYDMATLKNHLERQFESWMTWNNWGKYNPQTWNDQDSTTWVWQIDHIIPHSTFNYTSMEDDDFKKCWSLDNLRPYSAKLNVIEGSSRVRHKK